jgi:hypothetical protein
MKRVFLLMVVALLFCFTAAAQTSDTSSTKSSKKSKSTTTTSSTSETSGGAAKAHAKGNTVTGCVGGSAGSYTLTNGRYKNGVAVSGSDDLAPHIGHTVKLTGSWSEDKKTFNETKVDMVSASCTAGGGKKGASAKGGESTETTTTASTTTSSKKSSKKGAASAPPQQ